MVQEDEGVRTSTKLAIVAVVLLGGAVVAQTWRLQRERLRVSVETQARQKAVLEAVGWRAAKEATERQMAITVPALQEELEAARKEKAPVILGGRTITKTVGFAIPCGEGPLAATGAGPTVQASDTSSPAPPPVNLTLDQQFAVTALADGAIEWTGRTFATMTRGEWTQTEEMPPTDVAVSIDPRLSKAWREYVTGPRAVWEARVLVTGPAWGLRAGATWFGRGQHVGVAFDYDRTYTSETTCDYYQESCSSRYVGANGYAVGAAFRF